MLSVLIKHRLPLAWMGDGQRVPDDFHTARAQQLVTLAEALAAEDEVLQSDASWLHAIQTTEGAAHVQAQR